jgi:hypothetical protein
MAMLPSRSRDAQLIVLVAALFALALPAALLASDTIPRTASGKPDFTGTYDAATLTPLVRPAEFGEKLYLTKEEAEKIAVEEAKRMAERGQASDPNRTAPPDGGDGSEGAAGNVGGYNTFWIDRGVDAFTIDGKFRTSIIVDPKNGQMPPMTPDGQKRLAARFGGEFRRQNDGTAWWVKEGVPGPYANMEERNVAERCLLGFTGVAPTFPSLYNNFKRIVQTDAYVVIELEMVHDARVVRMNSQHPPAEVRKWLGDSIGWWEGDTLVVDTTNFRAESSPGRGGTAQAHVVERFTRMPDGNILYGFTVEDPSTWTAPWSGEYVWRASTERVFEYACHEGNYALGNIMRGARLLEQDAEKPTASN